MVLKYEKVFSRFSFQFISWNLPQSYILTASLLDIFKIWTEKKVRNFNIQGGERGLVIGRWTCNPEVPGSNPSPSHFVFGGPEFNSSTPCKKPTG